MSVCFLWIYGNRSYIRQCLYPNRCAMFVFHCIQHTVSQIYYHLHFSLLHNPGGGRGGVNYMKSFLDTPSLITKVIHNVNFQTRENLDVCLILLFEPPFQYIVVGFLKKKQSTGLSELCKDLTKQFCTNIGLVLIWYMNIYGHRFILYICCEY